MPKRIIAIVGKTASGKDTAARYLCEQYGITPVVSFTTRPKRDSETDGVEHYFVPRAEMALLRKRSDVIAYTINEQTGIEYCALADAFQGEIMSYIINPEGLVWMKQHEQQHRCDVTTIYIDLAEEDICARAAGRGDRFEAFRERLASERNEFDDFRRSGGWDVLIDNSGEKEYLLAALDQVMSQLGVDRIAREYEDPERE